MSTDTPTTEQSPLASMEQEDQAGDGPDRVDRGRGQRAEDHAARGVRSGTTSYSMRLVPS